MFRDHPRGIFRIPPATAVFGLLALYALSLLIAPVLHAQPKSKAKTYIGWNSDEDTLFHIGCTYVGNPETMVKLKFDFNHNYVTTSPEDWMRLYNLTPTTGMDTAHSHEWLEHRFRKEALANGYKIFQGVGELAIASTEMRVLDNYIRADGAKIHQYPLDHPDDTHDYFGRWEPTMYNTAFAITIGAVHKDTVVASDPAWISPNVMHRGNPVIYRRAGLPDRSLDFRISFAIRMDGINPKWSPDTVLAYYVLYHRITDNQQSCRCYYFEPFDTVYITKGMYQNADTAERPKDNNPGYREVGKTFSMIRDTVVYTRDSSIYKQVIDKITYNQSSGQLDTLYRDSLTHATDQLYWTAPFSTTLIGSRTTDNLSNHIHTVVHYDTLQRLLVPIRPPRETDFIGGTGDPFFGYRTCDTATCSQRRANGEFGPTAMSPTPEIIETDFTFSLHSTGAVPITFLRSRINQDLYDTHRRDTAVLHAIIRPGVDKFYLPQYAPLRQVIGRLVISDEMQQPKAHADGLNARYLISLMQQHHDSTRRLYQSVQTDFDADRILSGDIDSTRLKTINIFVRQDYFQINGTGDPVPVRYANPDSMDWAGTHKVYSMDTTIDGAINRWNIIAGNTKAAYDQYTDIRQSLSDPHHGFGKFRDRLSDISTLQGPLVGNTARAVDVAKFRYRKQAPSHPVYNSIQCFGYRDVFPYDPTNRTTIGSQYMDWSFRIPTPEEITAQVWLSLNCGVDGIRYADPQYDHGDLNYGFIDSDDGSSRLEYDSLKADHPNIAYRSSRMWLGLRSRYEAARRVNTALRQLDATMHLAGLRYNQEQLSLHDVGQSFNDIPLLQSARLEKSVQHNGAIDSGKQGYVATAPPTYDPRDSSFMEITHYLPSRLDAAGIAASAEYLLFTNRRTWPVDVNHYKDTTKYRGSRIVGASQGFGAIDVRRPLVKLKGLSVMADSFVIEKVLDTTWHMTAALGQEITLDWIEPGWGEMYRVRPIPTRVSGEATAYNNAVHGENPSTGGFPRSRFIVYDRDSSVYLRCMDAAGHWSTELRISDASDAQAAAGIGGGERRAYNIHPAVATTWNDSSTIIVWERHVPGSNLASVEASYFYADYPTSTNLATLWPVRYHLTGAMSLRSWARLTPAVVGVDSGFIVSFASPDTGVRVLALRDADLYSHGGTLSATDTSAIGTAIMPNIAVNGVRSYVDSSGLYPTLAYVPFYDSVVTNDGVIVGASQGGGSGAGGILQHKEKAHIAHLAYQQGNGLTNSNWRIMYNRIGFRFQPGLKPWLWISKTEEVTSGTDRCPTFEHPSIAADPFQVGVTFEHHQSVTATMLRLRPLAYGPGTSIDTSNLVVGRSWTGLPFYSWGGYDNLQILFSTKWRLKLSRARTYTRPSLTLFPSRPLAELRDAAEGALAWQWIDDPANSQNRLQLYRFGQTEPDTTLLNGSDPGMMLVPNKSDQSAITSTGVIHRGSGQTRSIGKRTPDNLTAFYYPVSLENTPNAPLRSLDSNLNNGAVVGLWFAATGTIITAPSIDCTEKIGVGILFGAPPPPGGGNPPVTGLPPTFFPTDDYQRTAFPNGIINLLDASAVSSTAPFAATADTVTITRLVMGSNQLISWLNIQPYDPAMGSPANIIIQTELVRQSDGAILWHDAPISARSLRDSSFVQDVLVPVGAYAPLDTTVFIRVRGYTTAGLDYSVHPGFQFLQGLENTGTTFKMVQPASARISESAENELSVKVIPNPARDRAELRVRVVRPGTIQITISDVLGRVVRTLPPATIQHAGEYAMPLDVSGLRDGSYTVRVENGESYGSTQMVIVK